MSSAQIIVHQRAKNPEYELNSKNISQRCKEILRLLETKLVTKEINKIIKNLHELGNGFDNSKKYDEQQKEFIKQQISDIAQ